MPHDLFHVVALVLFLAALASAFIGLLTPLLFEGPVSTKALRRSLTLGLAAALGLGADSIIHHLK